MRFIKRSARKTPKLTLILLDWSVRESFHLLHYLRRQSADRDQFEVVFIEYYSRSAESLKQFADQVDSWILLEMPQSCIYHKHLMYNCGLAFARGEIVVFCDSDAMVKDSFIETIAGHFECNRETVLHLDQFRNMRRDFYPFNYPSFEEVLGPGCINNVEGRTSGIMDRIDPLHSRNYGACMCVRRKDLIAIGGADEHIDYLGHICGPYEMTFRLVNSGLKEVWHETEYLFHVWHPGQAGVDNYQGPHDGRQMSRTALEALITRRTCPLVGNSAVALLQKHDELGENEVQTRLIETTYLREWNRSTVGSHGSARRPSPRSISDIYRGFRIVRHESHCRADTLLQVRSSSVLVKRIGLTLSETSIEDVIKKIDDQYATVLSLIEWLNHLYSHLSLLTWAVTVLLVETLKMIFGRKIGVGRQSSQIYTENDVRRFARFRRCLEKYGVGWLATRHYRAYMERCVNDLTANLYFANGRMQLPLIITTSIYLRCYFCWLSRLGVLPPLKIRRIRKAEVQNYFDQLSTSDYRQALTVTRDLFTNYYGLIQRYSQRAEVLVF
jgi:hypothetical protein